MRTQAALALGASKSKAAVEPLCSALSDANTTVRAAAAAALGKLSLGGERCLEARLSLESNESVKTTIRRSLERFAGGAEPGIGPNTRYYVSLGTLADQSGRTGGQVDRVVRAGMIQAARTLGGFAIAPRSETPEQASAKLSTHADLKAYHLAPKLPAPRYSGGNLTVKLDIAMFTYPGKALLGAYSVNLTMEGVADKDPASEDELISMIAGRAMEKFSQHVALLN